MKQLTDMTDSELDSQLATALDNLFELEEQAEEGIAMPVKNWRELHSAATWRVRAIDAEMKKRKGIRA